MHQIRLPAGALPQIPLGSSQRSPDPLAGFKGPTSKGRGEGQGRGEERERGRGKGGIGKGENGKGEERKEEGRGKKMTEGRRKVCLLLNGGLVTPLMAGDDVTHRTAVHGKQQRAEYRPLRNADVERNLV